MWLHPQVYLNCYKTQISVLVGEGDGGICMCCPSSVFTSHSVPDKAQTRIHFCPSRGQPAGEEPALSSCQQCCPTFSDMSLSLFKQGQAHRSQRADTVRGLGVPLPTLQTPPSCKAQFKAYSQAKLSSSFQPEGPPFSLLFPLTTTLLFFIYLTNTSVIWEQCKVLCKVVTL
jgi:hypothetical protein